MRNGKQESPMARAHVVCSGTERRSVYMVHEEEEGKMRRKLKGQCGAVTDSVGLQGP